jgi:hypothetical protein
MSLATELHQRIVHDLFGPGRELYTRGSAAGTGCSSRRRPKRPPIRSLARTISSRPCRTSRATKSASTGS